MQTIRAFSAQITSALSKGKWSPRNLSEKPSSNLTHVEDLSHPQSHPPKGTKKVPKEEERPMKVPSPLQRTLTQEEKKC
jgi:hypothetical protein